MIKRLFLISILYDLDNAYRDAETDFLQARPIISSKAFKDDY